MTYPRMESLSIFAGDYQYEMSNIPHIEMYVHLKMMSMNVDASTQKDSHFASDSAES